jgi:hypothetical protein
MLAICFIIHVIIVASLKLTLDRFSSTHSNKKCYNYLLSVFILIAPVIILKPKK